MRQPWFLLNPLILSNFAYYINKLSHVSKKHGNNT